MAEWIVLGTASAIPDEDHANTHFVLRDAAHTLLVDAPCEVAPRLRQAGIVPWDVTDLLLTHFHPDHTAGVPLFLMDAWLAGRRTPLHIYGLDDVLTRLQQIMGVYRWEAWPDFFPVHFHRIPEHPLALILETEGWKLWTSPVEHMIPAVGLRFEFANGEVLAYSGDTAPCEAVVALARNADYLFHEATGAVGGHTSAAQAGEIARQADVKRLFLVHTEPNAAARARLAAEATKTFGREAVAAEDLMRVTVGG